MLREGRRIRGQDVQAFLIMPSVYRVLKHCGLSWISTRSKHPKSNPVIQEDFKKKSKKVAEIVPKGTALENVEI